jgi:hypothetical protein
VSIKIGIVALNKYKTMKIIITLILSACGKTKQLIQSNIQQTGSDTADYKKLCKDECKVSSGWINYFISGLVASVTVLVSLPFADKAIYSSFKEMTAQSEVYAYNIFHTTASEWNDD